MAWLVPHRLCIDLSITPFYSSVGTVDRVYEITEEIMSQTLCRGTESLHQLRAGARSLALSSMIQR